MLSKIPVVGNFKSKCICLETNQVKLQSKT